MTGLEVFKRALRLLGYTDSGGETDAAASGELYKRGLAIVDQLCADLAKAETGRLSAPVLSLNAPLPLSPYAARQVLPYGVAMMLAAARGDGDSQQLFAAMYTQKRLLLRRENDRRTDVLPRGCDE